MESQNTPLVTIGMPTYNRANNFLHNALASAINQTYKNIEIIISDNCSTDHTESLVRDFGDPRIRYIKHRENIGAINNFNYCVNQAKGRYFVLLHDDDSIDEDFVEVCMKALPAGKDVGVIFTGNRVIDENGNMVSENCNRGAGRTTEEFLVGWFKNHTSLYLCSTMFNTEKLQEIGGFHSKTNHFLDVVAEVILAFKYGRADVYDVKASFRRHSSNMGGDVAKLRLWSQDCLSLMHLILEMASDNKDDLRKFGLGFFWRKNYSMACSIDSPLKRRIAFILLKIYFYNYHTVPRKILRRVGLSRPETT